VRFSSSAALLSALLVVAAATSRPTTRNDSTDVARSEFRLQPVRSSCEDSSGSFRLKAELRTSEARPVLGLVPSADPQVTAALVAGATRAFDEARAAGGPDLALVVGAASIGWASAASEAVRLACDERVVALVGPADRALAHPVAQAATRCLVPMFSTSRAPSVAAAGSKFVVPVVAADAAASESPTASSADWTAVGYDAGRRAVAAARTGGLSRAAFLAAAQNATQVSESAVKRAESSTK